MKKILLIALVAMTLCLSCNDKYPDLADGIYAEFVTDKGTMLAELYADDAPATVANFVALAEGNHPMADSAYAGKPFYNGLKFHRIIKNFMIQGGDPLGTGRGNPGYRFHDEFRPNRKHDTIGVLSMANSGPNTNGSQFFITQVPTPHLDGKHTVWGKVIKGHEVIDEITGVEMTDARAGVPKDPVLMQTVNVIRKGSAAKKFNAVKVFEEQLVAEETKKEEAEKAKAAAMKELIKTFDEKKRKADKLPSGLEIFWENKGEGEKPNIGDFVFIDYAVFFTNGELLDTSIKSVAESQNRVNPRPYNPLRAQYSPDAPLISGVKEGLQKMKVGDKVTLFIPYHLGYGENGRRGSIPPKSDLIFEMELKSILNK